MADSIKEFLVSIGYSFDEAGAKEWGKSLAKVTKAMAAIAAVVASAETAIIALVRRVTADLEATQWTADRAGSSAATLKSLDYALKQTGGGAITAPVEALAAALRTTPGLEGLLKRLGVAVREKTAEGDRLRDTGEILLDFIDATKRVPYVVGYQYAEWFGISEKDYDHLRRNSEEIRRFAEADKAKASAMGLDRKKLAASSALAMQSYRSLSMQIGAVIDGLVMSITPDIVKIIDDLNGWLKAHQGEVVSWLKAIVTGAIELLNGLGDLVASLVPVAEGFDRIIEHATGSRGLVRAMYAIGGIYLGLFAMKLFRPVNFMKAAVGGLVAAFVGYRVASSMGWLPNGQIPGVPDVWEKSRGETATPSFLGRAVNGVRQFFGGGKASGRAGGAGAGSTPEASLRFRPSPGPPLDRSEFEEELKDPRVRARLFAIIHAEVGGYSEDEILGFIETVFNRAKARKKSLWQTLHGGYWDPRSLARAPRLENDPSLENKYRAALDKVRRGSNTMRGATGNASGGVGLGPRGIPIYRGPHGELIGVEEVDLPWWRKNFLNQDISPPPSLMKDTPWGDPSSAIRPRASIDSPDGNSVTMNKSTRVTVYGDTNPHQTADDVAQAIGRSNDAMITATQRASPP